MCLGGDVSRNRLRTRTCILYPYHGLLGFLSTDDRVGLNVKDWVFVSTHPVFSLLSLPFNIFWEAKCLPVPSVYPGTSRDRAHPTVDLLMNPKPISQNRTERPFVVQVLLWATEEGVGSDES